MHATGCRRSGRHRRSWPTRTAGSRPGKPESNRGQAFWSFDRAADDPAEYGTLGAHAHLDRGQRRDHLVTDRTVSSGVVG